MQGKLVLSDGTVFLGQSFGGNTSTSGEVVFNTGMVGYPESLTDSSYYGQILVLTYPLQGNYGVPKESFWESKKIQVKGLVVSSYIDHPSHFESQKTLGDWLREEGIPALQGVDTRALTIKLRQHGVMLGKIVVRENTGGIYDPNKENILPYVSTKKIEVYGKGPSISGKSDFPSLRMKQKNIVLIDCGAKENIVRSLVKRGARVTRVPWDFNPLDSPPAGAKLDLAGGFDGVVISNGPGDPKQAGKTIETVRELIKKGIPIFGICLGSQILSLAAGGQTFKLKFGHRGQNQPVMDQSSKKAIITSQNHGFAVDMKSLSRDWNEWFVNLNDGTNEGIRHGKKPFMAVQFHPEANPGPTDAGYLFDEFLDVI